MTRLLPSIITLALVFSFTTQSQSVILQNGSDGYSGCQDAYINLNVAIRSGGVLDTTPLPLPMGSGGEIDVYHAKSSRCSSTFDPLMIITGIVIKFDLGSIPSGTSISNARLSLYAIRSSDKHSNAPKVLYPITKNWDESSATGETFFLNTKGIDLSTPVLGGDSAVGSWESFDVTEQLQAMVNGTRPNNGFMIMFQTTTLPYVLNETVKSSCTYAAQENSDMTIRPKLELELGSTKAMNPKHQPDHSGFSLSAFSSNRLAISSSGKSESVQISIHRADGRKVMSLNNVLLQAGTNEFSIDHLSAGTYLMSVSSPHMHKTFRGVVR